MRKCKEHDKEVMTSTDIHGSITFGHGALSDNGYWEIECPEGELESLREIAIKHFDMLPKLLKAESEVNHLKRLNEITIDADEKALNNLRDKFTRAESELRHIDEVLTRRPALNQPRTRVEKIEHAIKTTRRVNHLEVEIGRSEKRRKEQAKHDLQLRHKIAVGHASSHDELVSRVKYLEVELKRLKSRRHHL